MTHDEELIERVAIAMWRDDMLGVTQSDWGSWSARYFTHADCWRSNARTAIAAVRAYDAERRASVLDVAAAALVGRFDPDDYRDLPLSLEQPVRLKGGLTTDKRK